MGSASVSPHVSAASSRPSPTAWLRCVVVAGALVGLADWVIGFALFVMVLGRRALGVFQSAATGVLGPTAFRGGWPTAIVGIGLHFAISIGWAVLFAALYARVPIVRRWARHPAGLALLATAAGIIVWLVMNEVVMSLSRARPYPTGGGLWWALLALHIPFVGLPLVWGVRAFAPPRDFAQVAARGTAVGAT